MHLDETRSHDDQQTEDLTRTVRFGERPAAQPAKLPGKYKILSGSGDVAAETGSP